MSQSDPPRPSFTIGITGNMDLDFSEVTQSVLEARLKTIYLFLRYGWTCDEADAPAEARMAGEEFAKLLAYPRTEKELKPLRKWPGIGPNTEMVLLSSLAPGADTIAARVLLDLRKDSRYPNFRARVKVPLSFPEDLYLAKASSYQRKNSKADLIAYDEVRSQLLQDDLFLVHLVEDIASGVESLKQSPDPGSNDPLRVRLEKEVNLPECRRRRYQAAGEYVATFSDALIALYDDRFDSGSLAGSNSIVRAKRWGPTPGLLPLNPAVTWSDNGPVIHLYHPREESKKGGRTPPSPGPRLATPVRLLHPFDLGPIDEKNRNRLAEVWAGVPPNPVPAGGVHHEDQDPAIEALANWHARGSELAVKVVRNLREFNEIKVDSKDAAREPGELEAMTGWKLGDDAISAHLTPLDALARIRRRASAINGSFQDRSARTLRRLFLLGFAAAVLLHLFSHWHPQFHASGKDHGAESHLETVHAAQDHDVTQTIPSWWGTPDGRYKVVRLSLGTSAFVCALSGLCLFVWFMSDRVEERRYDYRAFAEGLRVQIYWGMAGLRQSVAANYVQRVRSEMDWIRNAISSLSFPSERFQTSFLRLGKTDQIEMLQGVVDRWVRPRIPDLESLDRNGGRQEDYFYMKESEEREKLQLLHQSGSCIALAGLAIVPVMIVFAKSKGLVAELMTSPAYVDFPRSMMFAGVGLLLLSTALGIAHRVSHHGHGSHGSSLFSPWKHPKSKWRPSFAGIFTDLFFHRHSAREEFGRAARLRQSTINFVFALAPSLGLASLALALVIQAARWTHELPGPLDLGIVVMGSCLVGGALLIAYAERQLLSEHSHQYRAAHSFFASTRLRLEEALENLRTARGWAEEPDNHGTRSTALWKAEKSARLSLESTSKADVDDVSDPQTEEEKSQARSLLIAHGEAEFIRHRERIHQLLYALGKEALDENSEWLILHRSRPMEPVMAG